LNVPEVFIQKNNLPVNALAPPPNELLPLDSQFFAIPEKLPKKELSPLQLIAVPENAPTQPLAGTLQFS
jgi:hypothetical protein